ncbi:MAG: sulfide/dihydroorotate dehydrogenase-like FAD/NAD-binding protein, partial [Eubacteriales bacterium]
MPNLYKIIEKRILNDLTVFLKVEAPRVAAKARPGQFVIIRADETAERVPFTIAEYNAAAGTVAIIFQTVGAATKKLALKNEGEYLTDFVGPLGNPSELEGYKNVAVIGGGLGCAIAYPQAKYLHEHGSKVDIIAGFRNTDVIILENEMKSVCDSLTIMTDDGSNGSKGLVTDGLKAKIDGGEKYDL